MTKIDIYFTIIDIFKNLDDIAPIVQTPYSCEAFKTLTNPFFQNRFVEYISQKNKKNAKKIYNEFEEFIDNLNNESICEMKRMGLAHWFVNKYSKPIYGIQHTIKG